MEIFFSPRYSTTNKYIENLIKSINANGISITNDSFSKAVKNKDIIFFHFNWFISGNNLKDIFYGFKQLLLLKFFNKKIIWTLHNKLPHETKYLFLALLLRWCMAKLAYKIIIHCKEESLECLKNIITKDQITKKVVYVNIGNYIGTYENNFINLKSQFKILDSDFVFMFIGAIRPYKGIETLIKAFSKFYESKFKLILAGNPLNAKYKKNIENIASCNPNIICDLKFIPDSDLMNYLNTADVLVFPYNGKHTLNSSCIFLGLNYEKLIVSSSIGTIKDFPSDILFTYTYKTEEEEIDNLFKKLLEVFNCNNKEERRKKGLTLMKNDYTWEKASSILKQEVYI